MPHFQIRCRFSGAVRFEGEFGSLKLCVEAAVRARADLARANLAGANLARANLARANLAGANLAGANLAGAYLARAYLAGADLARANLADANLADADLARANLARANLADAKGLTIERTSPLALLRYQPGPIRLFKVLNTHSEGHINGGLAYPMGKRVAVTDASADPTEMCGPGIHVATLDWCLREWRSGYTIAVMEFTAADIACIPLGTDGKLRLHGCTRVEDIPVAEIARMLGKAEG